MKNPELLSRITARSDIFGGKPIVRDMRISVELILSLLSQGVAQSEILDDYPELEPDDIRACTAYAHAVYRQRHPVRGIGHGVLRFLIDRCAGRNWGNGCAASAMMFSNPVNSETIRATGHCWRAEVEARMLVTLDIDFAELIHVRNAPRAGLVRLPDVPVEQRVNLMVKVLERHREALETRAVITVRGDRIRISRPPRVRAVSQE